MFWGPPFTKYPTELLRIGTNTVTTTLDISESMDSWYLTWKTKTNWSQLIRLQANTHLTCSIKLHYLLHQIHHISWPIYWCTCSKPKGFTAHGILRIACRTDKNWHEERKRYRKLQRKTKWNLMGKPSQGNHQGV